MQAINLDSSESEDENSPPRSRLASDVPPVAKDEEENKSDQENDHDAGDGDENDDEEEEEELYVVEEILDHQFEEGVLLYKIKWEGYDKKADQTWESEDKLEGASEALKEYHSKIGGKPYQRKPSATGKRARTDSKPNTPTTTKSHKHRRLEEPSRNDSPIAASETKWMPPKETWEHDVMQVDTIERDDQGLYVYLDWNNGKKTRHPIEKTYRKCPMKMLRFYEQHLYYFLPARDERDKV